MFFLLGDLMVQFTYHETDPEVENKNAIKSSK